MASPTISSASARCDRAESLVRARAVVASGAVVPSGSAVRRHLSKRSMRRSLSRFPPVWQPGQ